MDIGFLGISVKVIPVQPDSSSADFSSSVTNILLDLYTPKLFIFNRNNVFFIAVPPLPDYGFQAIVSNLLRLFCQLAKSQPQNNNNDVANLNTITYRNNSK